MNLPPPALLTLRVEEARDLNPLIRLIRLVTPDGSPLPGYTPGACVRVRVKLPNGQTDWRQYSLVNDSTAAGAFVAPAHYLIAIRREDQGRGGSIYMHRQVQVGQLVMVEAPRNEFELGQPAGCAVLVAGGIGVTPLVGMAAQRIAEGGPVRMHYAGRSRSQMAFLSELLSLLRGKLHVHADDEVGAPLNVDAVLDACAPSDELFVCGPKPLLDAVLAKTHARGWARERVHFEVFAPVVPASGDHGFDVVLAQDGRTVPVKADQSILDALIDAGCDPLFDCKRGECGVCAVPVIEGEVDHRDYVLSETERQAGKSIHICISRCKGQRLVIDL